ncbi:hypothetical protein Tco_0872808 [Tanacetum coccineum]
MEVMSLSAYTFACMLVGFAYLLIHECLDMCIQCAYPTTLMTVHVERNQAGLSNTIPSALNKLLEECQLVFAVPNSIALNDNKGVSSKGPSIASVPKEGPSIPRVPKDGPSQEILDWYGYDTVKEYLEDTFFDSTDKDTTDKDSTNEDTIHESYSPKSKGKYVPVSQKHKPKVIFKSPILIIGCVLGLANVHIWDDILKKFGVTKPESCADKAKGKRKVSYQAFALQVAFTLLQAFAVLDPD